jgi:DNA polymerase-3 subunit beta
MVSTDTHRLSLVDSPITEGKGEATAIVPGRAMGELHRIVSDEEGTVTVNITQSQILFNVDDSILVSRLIEGQFPNFQKVIPQEFSKRLIVPTDQFQQSVRRAAIVARDNANRIILRTADAKLTINAESSTVGTAYEEVDIVRDGDDIEMAFSAKYLLDFLSIVETEAIEMQLTGNLSPALLKPQESEDYNYVLMPMQIR